MKNSLTARMAIRKFSQYAMGGAKAPHGISNPVFCKMEDGSYALAAFVFTYNGEMIKNKKVKSPSEWILINPNDGALIDRISCATQNFSDLEDSEIDFGTGEDIIVTDRYKSAALIILNFLIKSYVDTGCLDIGLNNVYMYMVLQVTAAGFRPYYEALNQI